MNEYLKLLKNSELFYSISENELEKMLLCIGANVKSFQKREILLLAGEKIESIGFVLTGNLHIVREDYDGNTSLIGTVAEGEVFAEALCSARVLESPVSVIAATNSKVMYLSFSRILGICNKTCVFHTKLIENMLKLIANKNLMLQSRMEIISLKSIRTKVLHYLKTCNKNNKNEIIIPLNRNQMADFLCVERSALSHELAKMKKEGIIEYKKNKFIILFA